MAIFVTTSLRNYEKIDEKLFELIYFNKKLISAIFYNRNYTKFIGILSKKKNINLPRKKEILLEILNFILLYEFSKKNEHVFFLK
ncbi:hypothetical protein CPARA_2gp202 (nucleomorph) [Cryptomonas paramecium]|uniref:Uncharacterized protein n=1 Tax=Cryptomonas paramaecium TaxID=2898 RepID=F2HHR4_9CRYP|nr:hypothetical protein CPARA_2gp202 [Cryptomonas paramecium]AEA38860.1 hypothetical protein CPARA_2gp202 [Cryptomonas paramecium]